MSGGGVKVFVKNRGSNLHLWNLLKGNLVLVHEDVIFEELRDNLDRIFSGLTYYASYEKEDENEAKIRFPLAPSFARSLFGGSGKKKDEGGTTSDSATLKRASDSEQGAGAAAAGSNPDSGATSFDKIRKAVAQNLDIRIDVATDLVISYMMFECRGPKTSYDEIADTQASFNAFLQDLKYYYSNERICLLLSIQAVLASLGDEEHKLFSVIESSRTQITYKKWCWGLLRSIALAKNEMEVVETLHCLALLMYKLPNDTIAQFFAYFNKNGFEEVRRTEKMRMAEGIAMYSALVVSGITDCCTGMFPHDFGDTIREFLTENFEQLLLNSYNCAPLFASYDIFGKEDQGLTRKMKNIKINASATFSSMLKLTEHYGKGELHDRHSLSLTVASGIFETFEIILSNFDTSHFGTNQQAVDIFSRILLHNLVAENFLCGTPLALTALYTDATSLFPLDIASTLQIWKSLCMSVRSIELCNTIVRGVAKMNSIAEFFDEEVTYFIRRFDDFKVANLKSRTVYNILLDEGVNGMINDYRDGQCIVWDLPSSLNVSGFDVIRWSIQPIADALIQMKAECLSDFEFQRFNYAPADLHAISEFVVQFWKTTDEQVPELASLVHPLCLIMETMLKYKTDMNEKIRLIEDLFGVVGSVNEFCIEVALMNYIYDFLPGDDKVSLVEEMIVGLEAVTLSHCKVTRAFLNLICSFAENEKCWRQGHSSVFETTFIRCIKFIAENILCVATRWRIENNGIRFEIYLKCLKIFTRIYSLSGSEWTPLKQECLQYLISPGSCLIDLLQTDELKLLNSVIRPTDDDMQLSTVLSTALRLLYRVIRFNSGILRPLNDILDGLLVRILGKLFRHRLIPNVPTLSIMNLTEVAKGSTLSLLACFGNDEAAFRDVIIQRLEFATEDVNLKVTVLEFLTVIAQTQVGIIEYFFSAGALEDSILALIHENESLSVACLHFIRSMFRQGLPCPKHREIFWINVLSPIKTMMPGGSLEIVSSTLHILTFEIFVSGLSEKIFINQVEKLMQKEQLGNIMEMVILDSDEVAITKCLKALKHYFTLLLGRSEFTHLVPPETLEVLQKMMLDKFKKTVPRAESLLSTNLAELLIILTTPALATSSFLSDLLLNLNEIFRDHSLSAQLPLLCLVNKCYLHCSDPLKVGDLDNTFRILKRVFETFMKLLDENRVVQMYPILTVAARTFATIIETQGIDVWGVPMQKQLLPSMLVELTSGAINNITSPNVVANCLAALIALAEHPSGYTLIPSAGIARAIYGNLAKFTEETNDPWNNVFFLCLNLNSKLLENQQQEYLEEALEFWGLYSGFLNQKLSVMANLTEICVGIEDTDKGYNDMKSALSRTAFILNDIVMMCPYIEKWQCMQPTEVYKTIRNVFFVLQEICGLLQQPFLLQSSVVGQKQRTPSSTSSVETKPLPRVTEIQLKLWELCDICLQIFVKLRSKDEEFFEKHVLIPTVFQVGHLSIKAITKADRKYQVGVHLVSRVSSVLEKVVMEIYKFSNPILSNPAVDYKYQANFRREWSMEVTTICDGIRRLNLPKTDFLLMMCIELETKFK